MSEKEKFLVRIKGYVDYYGVIKSSSPLFGELLSSLMGFLWGALVILNDVISFKGHNDFQGIIHHFAVEPYVLGLVCLTFSITQFIGYRYFVYRLRIISSYSLSCFWSYMTFGIILYYPISQLLIIYAFAAIAETALFFAQTATHKKKSNDFERESEYKDYRETVDSILNGN